MISIKALLFDFDGVLANTEPLHWKAWLETLAPYSPVLDWNTYERVCIGVSEMEMQKLFCTFCEKPIAPGEVKALYPKKRKIFQALTATADLVDDRVVAMLARLANLQLAVVTSSNRLEVEPLLRQANLLSVLNTVVYGNDVKRYKPCPDPYLLAVERLHVAPSESVVFEDSAAGIQSGKAAGCRVVEVKECSQLPELIEAVLSDGSDF